MGDPVRQAQGEQDRRSQVSIPLIEQAKIQAQVLVPLVKALQA